MKTSVAIAAVLAAACCVRAALGDGTVVPPRDYKGSLEERSQEAIVIFQGGKAKGEAKEDLILKIQVEGEAPPQHVPIQEADGRHDGPRRQKRHAEPGAKRGHILSPVLPRGGRVEEDQRHDLGGQRDLLDLRPHPTENQCVEDRLADRRPAQQGQSWQQQQPRSE